ncbi:MAG: class I SAM-dependent rRNA methyltransferase [Saprospiraceae bacterium]
MQKIFLKPGRDASVRRFHPWVFSGAIARSPGSLADGDWVRVCAASGEVLAVGHYHDGSISVKIQAFGDLPAAPGAAFFSQKIQAALGLRRTAGLIGRADTNCFRLIHGEGDGMGGLIVDVYGDTAVAQCHSIGMHRDLEAIAAALRTLPELGLRRVYSKSADTLPARYASEHAPNGYVWQTPDSEGEPDEAVIGENGILFKVNWAEGQKTGFFLDQRDNRALLSRYASGRSVLNTFCYTGGFSCYALAAGAALVHSVDVSAKAIALTEENMRLNAGQGEHASYAADTLRFLKECDRQYDLVVTDPPAFAKTVAKRHNAVQGYKRLNAAALRVVKPGGLLFAFSCSQVIDRALFQDTIVAAALESGREACVLHHLSQGADHPVNLFHPEGSYLKGLAIVVR